MATDQGVVLDGPFTEHVAAAAARAAGIGTLRGDLIRTGRAFIAERLAAIAVRWGVRVGPWQGFEAVARPEDAL